MKTQPTKSKTAAVKRSQLDSTAVPSGGAKSTGAGRAASAKSVKRSSLEGMSASAEKLQQLAWQQEQTQDLPPEQDSRTIHSGSAPQPDVPDEQHQPATSSKQRSSRQPCNRSQVQATESEQPLEEPLPRAIALPLQPQSPQVKQQLVRDLLEEQVAAGLVNLAAQAEYINGLAGDLEAALFQFKGLAHKINQDRRAIQEVQDQSGPSADQVPDICEYLTTAVPFMQCNSQGFYKLTTRAVDLLKAEREAAFTAQLLRNRMANKQPTAKLPSPVSEKTSLQLPPQPQKGPDYRRWLRNLLKPPQDHLVLVVDAIAWIAVAVALRVGLQFLLSIHPALWLPAMLLLITPAMIVAYQITFMAQSGFILGYRLFLIMLGLLLGGRL